MVDSSTDTNHPMTLVYYVHTYILVFMYLQFSLKKNNQIGRLSMKPILTRAQGNIANSNFTQILQAMSTVHCEKFNPLERKVSQILRGLLIGIDIRILYKSLRY